MFFVFFFKQKTAYEMRISDWSSDVCSSDLMVLLADATPVIMYTTAETRFKITAAQLERAITPRTRMLWLNSPSNPAGMAYSKAELRALAEGLRQPTQTCIATDDTSTEARRGGAEG